MFHQAPPPFPNFALVLSFDVAPDDLAEAALRELEASPETHALVSLTCTLTDASDHPESLTAERLSSMAPLLRTVLAQDEPAASNDLQQLWDFVDECFEPESPVRTLFADVVAERPNERFASILAGSVLALGPH